MADQSQDLADVPAVILCGGLGTRLRSVVADRAKAVALIGDQPFLALQLKWLWAQGIRTTWLAAGYHAESIRTLLPEITPKGMTLHLICEPHPLGTGGAILNLWEQVEGEVVMVLNGDSMVAADLKAFFAFHRHNNAQISVLASAVEDASAFGVLTLNEKNQILSFSEKKGTGAGLVNAGVYLFQKTSFPGLLSNESLVPGQAFSLENDFFRRLSPAGFLAYVQAGHFLDIGTPVSYADAQVDLGRYLHIDDGT